MISTIFNRTGIVITLITCTLMLFTGVVNAQAQEELRKICLNNDRSPLCQNYKPDNKTDNPVQDTLVIIINILFFIVGVLAVIFIIYGGFKYVKGGGESSAVGEAKKTILYAIIGLVLAIIAPQVIAFGIGWFF